MKLNYIAEQLRPLAVPIASLTPDPKNAMDHPEENLETIRSSLARFGQRKPIVVRREGMVVSAGNGTLASAKTLGWEFIAAVICDDSEQEAKAFALVDNRSAQLAEWDTEQLSENLKELQLWDPDTVASLGWSMPEVKLLTKDEPQADPDDVPEAPTVPVTKPGDLYLLGTHRLLCGDARRSGDVSLVMDGSRATCVFTDPPYGVSIGAKNRMLNSVQPAGRNLTDIADDSLSPGQLEAELLPAFTLVRDLAAAEDCTVFLTAPQGGELGMMMMMMQKAGLKIRHVLIWRKNVATFSVGRLDYDYQHEPILMTWSKRHKRPMLGAHTKSVWDIDKPRSSPEHPTMKPVELYRNAYRNHCDPGDVVFDPYSGSGPAFIAAEEEGMLARGIELEPRYCDVIVRRWETFTGKKAELLPPP